MSQNGIPARRAALYLLDQVINEGRLLSDLIAEGALSRLEVQDRARAQRLATQTLRALPRADRTLSRFMTRTPPAHVRNLLRLSTVELANGEASHGVVNDAVEIIGRSQRHQRMKGLVNAVLRKVAADVPDGWDKLGIPRLPKWLRDPLKSAYGPDTVSRIEAAHFAGAPLDLTAKGDPEELAQEVGGALLPTGTVRIQNAGQVSKLSGFDEGRWWVQDAAASIPVKLLSPKAGDKILDLCCAPGGKTLQLAAAGAKVTAVDISDTRLGRLRQNLTRTTLSARVITSDARVFEEAGFDAVVLDAPCSATGTIRRHPDLPYAKDGSEFFELFTLQADLLDKALTCVKPGGVVIYCTCSLLPDEGEAQIDEALKRHSGLTVDTKLRDQLNLPKEWHSSEGGLRLRPDFLADQGGMDGFYIAALRRSV